MGEIETKSAVIERSLLVGLPVFEALILLLAGGCGGVPPNQTPAPTEVESSTTSPTIPAGTTTTLSGADVTNEWYEKGNYLGYWSGNVETIPTKTSDLPDFFYDGATPSRAVLRDNSGTPLEMDPATIERPVWVFGDEIDFASYADEVRMTKNDGRPVLFYGTHVSGATDALGLERQGEAR